ncbi:LytTR family transcriptional regulator DNA-binding domain-containing protein [Paenibacillus sp. FSL R7-0345]|uniref:LytTR family transcriptional regulator DNA-binding domain-containing protein n=1 Tax=Paenibacillus sp. FSL R7-0345 TaxID=2954535 RepID=UPI003159BC20
MNVRAVLLGILTGKLPVAEGEIRINGHTYTGHIRQAVPETGFLLLEEGEYTRLTVKENLRFYSKLYGYGRPVEEVMRIVRLDAKAGVRLSALSHSERKRVQYARLIIQDAQLLVCEEPDQNVDNETKLVFRRLVQQLCGSGKAVLILTGNMETALSITNRVYRLDEKGLQAFDIQDQEEQAAESAVPEPSFIQSADETESSRKEDGQPDGDIVKEEEAAEEIEQTLQLFRFEKIPTRMNDKIILFNPPEIDYVESSDGQTQLSIGGELYPTAFKINELQERLHSYGFFRCHRSYLVNLQKVREVITFTRNSYSLVLDDVAKTSVPLSKTKMAELKEMMGLK